MQRSESSASSRDPEIFLILLLGMAIEAPVFEAPVGILYASCCLVLLTYLFMNKIPESFASSIAPITLLLLLFPIGALFALQNEAYNTLKDVWYLSKIILYFSLGFVLASQIRNLNNFLELYVGLSVITSIIYLLRLIFNAEDQVSNIMDAANSAGLPNVVTVFALPLMFRKEVDFALIRGGITRFLVAAVMLTTIGFSYSRTYMVCSVLAFLATLGLFRNFGRLILLGSFAGLVGVLASYSLATNGAPGSISPKLTFETKILNSLKEISFTNGSSGADMLRDWRGFEAFMAFREFENASLPKKIFGRGLGATVDLGMYVQVSPTSVERSLPMLHNGYFSIIGKYGLVGLLLYALFILRVIRGTNRWGTQQDNLLSDIRVGVGLEIAATSLVFFGLFGKSNLDGVCIFAGVLYGYRWAQERLYGSRLQRLLSRLSPA